MVHTLSTKIRKLLSIVFVISCLFFTNQSALAETAKKPQVLIAYFYVNACGSCNEEGKLHQKYDELIGKLDDAVNVKLEMHNTFHSSEAIILKEYLESYRVPDDKRQIPILFINGTYLSGTDEIDARLKTEFSKAIKSRSDVGGLPGGNLDSTVSNSSGGGYEAVENKSDDSVLLYFYLTSCEDCNKVAKILKTFKKGYTFELDGEKITSGIIVKKFNAGESDNIQLLKEYFNYYKVPEKDQKVPILFAGSRWYSGAEAVKNSLEKAVSRGDCLRTVELHAEYDKPEVVKGDRLTGYDILGVAATGLVNGLNPCSLSIVLFFLSLLAVKNVNLLKAGIIFISGKFIMFFLLGTLLYRLFLKADIDWFQTVIKIIIVTLAALLMFLNVQDMISAKNEKYNKIRLQLPENLRRLNHRMVKVVSGIDSERVFFPLSFLLGMVIAAGEFLCTGQIYLAAIVLVLRNSTVFDIRAILYFAIYGIAFILPLVLLTVLVHKGKEVFEVSEAVRAKMPLIKMINAFVFLVFALLTIVLS